jgi:hypothetical protein
MRGGRVAARSGSRSVRATVHPDLIAFLTVAVALFFFVVKPINTLMSLARHDKPADPNTRRCPACLSEIPLKARRCAYCTSNVQEIPNTEPAAQVDAAR